VFGKGKVVRDGAQAQAVVVGMKGGSQRGAMFGLQLRVHFDDGSTGEVFRRVGMHGSDELPWFVEGSTVPVRYDPIDHSKVEIDIPALKASHRASLADERSARSTRLGGASTPARGAGFRPNARRWPRAVINVGT
jgi:hypothetical protein